MVSAILALIQLLKNTDKNTDKKQKNQTEKEDLHTNSNTKRRCKFGCGIELEAGKNIWLRHRA